MKNAVEWISYEEKMKKEDALNKMFELLIKNHEKIPLSSFEEEVLNKTLQRTAKKEPTKPNRK
jgi:hypothetical protein